ncbi:MAG: hypothetical protein R8G01_02415 [Ilumatobacteraceae bacterium]|nr:hypothetical protein [Ilumatobacteraceae bacterium]
MPDDLESQLKAFGATLESHTGEPIASGSPENATTRATRRWWSIAGAAACLLAIVVGLVALTGRDAEAPAVQPVNPAVLVPAPAVPVDGLRLDDEGWILTRHSRSAFTVIDAMSCGETRELAALSGHEVVVEEYQGSTGAAWMRVTHVSYPDLATAVDRVGPFTDLRNCPDADLDGYEQIDLDAGPDVTAMGYRQHGSAEVAFIGGDGGTVLARVGNDDSAATLQLLAERSAVLLGGRLDSVPPDGTVTGLDDLAAMVGDDPIGLMADGWTEVSYGLTPFEPQTWPVCGPPDAVDALAGVSVLDAVFVSPSEEGTWVRFLRVDDPAARAALGSAFVAESECPASSQPDLGASVAVESDAEAGRWRRSERDLTSVLVAPRGAGALPLVATVTGESDRVEALADRAAAFIAGGATASPADPVGDDPLGLERDGWTLVQRDTESFAAGELPCGVAAVVEGIDGADQVHDMLTPPDGDGLDLDIQIVDVGSIERGQALAEFVAAIGDCIADTQGIAVETGAMSSIRATWFRAGPDFALVAIVGEGARSIVLEIEGAPFDDDLIGALAERADQFLRGESVAEVEVIEVVGGSDLGTPQVEPVAGQVKLWVSNQSFEDDPVAVTIEIDGVQIVDDSFEVGGQHNWFSFLIDGLEPGEHTLTATSGTGAVFEGTFTLPPDEPRWMVVDYWHYPDDTEGRHFTFDTSDEPIIFS